MQDLHSSQTEIFTRAAAQNKMHHAWLLSGPKGVGKSVWARQRAAALLGVSVEHLIYHTHFLTLGSREEPLVIDQLREAKSFFKYAPLEDKPKIVLIDNLDAVNEKTCNALLKILEEPPAHTIFLMISHQPYHLLPTLQSRMMRLNFIRLTDDVTQGVVFESCPKHDKDAYRCAKTLYPGQPGKIISFLESNHFALIQKYEAALRGENIEFDKDEETKDCFYLLAKIIHKKRIEKSTRSFSEGAFVTSANTIINDCFLYNLDKKTAMISIINSL